MVCLFLYVCIIVWVLEIMYFILFRKIYKVFDLMFMSLVNLNDIDNLMLIDFCFVLGICFII